VTRVLVDSDIYAYSCGAATQAVRYDVAAVSPDGEASEALLDSMDDVRAWKAEEWPEGTEFTVSPVVEPEPIENAIHLVRRSIQNVERVMDEAGVEYKKLELYMTGKGNFRDSIATIKPYKGNRDRNQRPYHYKAIRRYLEREWGAETVEGWEADDQLAMAEGTDVIFVSYDKDLKTVAGRHYNPGKKEWSWVSQGDAQEFFYRQVITGDTTDNIPGCYKAGDKAADAAELLAKTPREMYETVLRMYEASLSKKGCPYVEMGAEAALLENARLLHLIRYPGELWTPPI
jgi:hypothetical protein